jgi:hypothetical protein
MSLQGPLKVLRELRDLQVVDQHGQNCGICDDVEFEGAPGQPLILHSLLVGTAPMLDRLPVWLSHLGRLIVRAHTVRIPWEDVETVTSRIKLRRPAGHYGLLRTDRRLARYLKRIPAL